ncbi:MAG: 30S ribosomal protein S17 [Candidatus Heimdallarchaeota archaeon]
MSKTIIEGRDIGFAPAPEKTCTDYACPFHGNLSVRGKVLEGIVVNDVTGATVTVERNMLILDRKYKRYLKKYSKISAHKTPCIDVKKGDKVKIGECRKISKTIAFVVLEVIESVN